jgi:hypothetical protein
MSVRASHGIKHWLVAVLIITLFAKRHTCISHTADEQIIQGEML